MANQDTIEIKLIVRDEMSKVLDDAFSKMRRHDSAFSTGKFRTELDAMRRGIQFVHRELSAFARLTGVSTIIGGGLVASIAAATKALGDFARERLNLHYTSQALGVTSETLSKFTDALTALGKTHGEAASGIESAMSALRDMQTFGNKSSLWELLAKGVRGSGDQLRHELLALINGPGGMEAALTHLFKRMQGMNPEAQRALAKGLGLGGVNARDIAEILPLLNKRIELGLPQAKALVLANTNLGISMSNISTTLASALMPALTKLITALDRWLQSEAGQKFVDQLKKWTTELTEAINKWIAEGGLDRVAATLRDAVKGLQEAFTGADQVIQAMGLSWPKVIGALILLPFAAWLAQITLALSSLMRFRWMFPWIAALGAGAYVVQRTIKNRVGEGQEDPNPNRNPFTLEDIGQAVRGGTIWDRLRGRGGGSIWRGLLNSMSGEGQAKNEDERRADLDADRRSKRELAEEVGKFTYSFAKLNDSLLMPGGPEGGMGPSGFALPSFGRISNWGGGGGGVGDRSIMPSLGNYGNFFNHGGMSGGGGPGSEFPEDIRAAGIVPVPTDAQMAGAIVSSIPGGGAVGRGMGWIRSLTPKASEFSFGGGGGNMGAINFNSSSSSSINQILAGGGGSLGSATVDIDVGGLGGGEKHNAHLFNPMPLSVPMQMQAAGADTVAPSPNKFQ